MSEEHTTAIVQRYLAALTGCGRGADVAKLSAEERTRWRKQARVWLVADLAAWAKLLNPGPSAERVLVEQTLAQWQADPALAGVREVDALDKLPTAERQEWHTFWNDCDAMLQRARNLKE